MCLPPRSLALGVGEAVIDTTLIDFADFIFETAFVLALAHVVLLQHAFASFVTDRAVKRVVDQQELHHALCAR